MMRVLRKAGVVSVVMLLTACASAFDPVTPTLPTASGPAPALQEGKARVYLYREAAGMRTMWFNPIFELNDTNLYDISSSTVYVFDISPCDPCSFYLRSPPPSMVKRVTTSGFHKLPLKAGETVYLKIGHSVGDTLSPGTKAMSMVLSGDPADKLLYNLTVEDAQQATTEIKMASSIRYAKVE